MGREAFKTDSGRINDYVITVTDAYFEVVPGYRDGTDWFLHWVGTTDSESQPIMDREGYHPSWKLGDGWTSVDGGKTVSHPTKENFHAQSAAGELIDTLIAITSEDGEAKFDPDPLAGDDVDPIHAGWYVGMKFMMGESEHTFNIDGSDQISVRPMPTEYLGMADPAESPAPAAAAPAASPNGVSKATLAKLKALAKKSDDHETFEVGALDLDGVVEDEALLDQIVDAGPAGFYATARA